MKVTEDENGVLSSESVNDGFSKEMLAYILRVWFRVFLANKQNKENRIKSRSQRQHFRI